MKPKIELLCLDVDGVLTDTRVFMDSDGDWKRLYSIRDGVGIVELRKAGFKTAIITGSEAEDVRSRAKRLKFDYFFEGALDKQPAFEELMKQSGLKPEQIAYCGDDIYDIPLLEQVGWATTVPDAVDEVKSAAHYVTKRPGGLGAVREICDILRKDLVDDYR